MKTEARYFSAIGAALLLLCVTVTGPVLAKVPGQLSASSGHLLKTDDRADPVEFAVTPGQKTAVDKYLVDGAVTSKSRESTPTHLLDSGFWIYDASAVLYFDDDDDGFYSGLDVTFDADTDFFSAEVYARLYVSLEGGPWILYYTTDVFNIYGAGDGDDYLVETDLIDGYPTGYYDVYIELYDYEFDEFVAGFGPDDTSALSDLPLEDETRNAGYIPPPAPPVSYSNGGGGSTGLLLLLVASLTLVWRATVRSSRIEVAGAAQPR